MMVAASAARLLPWRRLARAALAPNPAAAASAAAAALLRQLLLLLQLRRREPAQEVKKNVQKFREPESKEKTCSNS